MEDTGGGIDKDKPGTDIQTGFERLSNAATGVRLRAGTVDSEKPCGTDGGQHIGREHTGTRAAAFSVVPPLPQAEKADETDRKAAAKQTRRTDVRCCRWTTTASYLGMIHDIFVQNGVHCDTCTSTGENGGEAARGHHDLLTTDLKMGRKRL